MPRSMSNVTAMVIIGFIIVFSLAGCSSVTTNANKTLTIPQIEEKIKQTVDLSSMKPGDAIKLKKLYDINRDELEAFALYTAPSNLKADELLVLKPKTGADLTSIKAKVAKRVDKQSTAFKDYLPQEYFLIQKYILRTNGSYLMFVISKDAEKIAAAFDQILK